MEVNKCIFSGFFVFVRLASEESWNKKCFIEVKTVQIDICDILKNEVQKIINIERIKKILQTTQ